MFFKSLEIVKGREIRLCNQVERLALDFRDINGGNQCPGDILHQDEGTRITALAPDLAYRVPGPHADAPVEWAATASKNNARAKDNHRQTPFAVACDEKFLGRSLCPGVKIPPGDVAIQRRCLGDCPGLGSRII